MLTIKTIIDESDIMVPNAYETSDKVIWLNEINQDFFDKVKIPLISRFITIANKEDYKLSSSVRAKNIDRVQVGPYVYENGLTEDVNPTLNHHTFDDTTNTLTLSPAPLRSGLSGFIRYFRIAITNFVVSNLNAVPDAPPEYHWIYTLGLCARIAKSQDEIAKGNNYESSYNNALSVAAQNYAKPDAG